MSWNDLPFFRLLNAAKKKRKFTKHGLRKFLATIIIWFEVIGGVRFEERINNRKCGRAESAVPFAHTLICLGHATSCKPDTWYEMITYEKEYWCHVPYFLGLSPSFSGLPATFPPVPDPFPCVFSYPPSVPSPSVVIWFAPSPVPSAFPVYFHLYLCSYSFPFNFPY